MEIILKLISKNVKNVFLRINKAFHKIMNKFPVPITPVYSTTPKILTIPRMPVPGRPTVVQVCANTLKSCTG